MLLPLKRVEAFYLQMGIRVPAWVFYYVKHGRRQCNARGVKAVSIEELYIPLTEIDTDPAPEQSLLRGSPTGLTALSPVPAALSPSSPRLRSRNPLRSQRLQGGFRREPCWGYRKKSAVARVVTPVS